MHKYLRAIGFSEGVTTKNLLKTLEEYLTKNFDFNSLPENSGKEQWAEFKVYYGDSFGILWSGYFYGNKDFEIDHFIPFFEGRFLTEANGASFDRKKDDAGFMGLCDDVRIGVSLIFQVQNSTTWFHRITHDELPNPLEIKFSALAQNGSVLLPILKPDTSMADRENERKNRVELITAARKGDEKAIETLTIEDMDTYSKLSKRIMFEDVFSIVDSSFMPYGLECDLYTIVADIINVKKTENKISGEELYILALSCNDFLFDLIINASDLLGEPLPGRRFKGQIWLQGALCEG